MAIFWNGLKHECLMHLMLQSSVNCAIIIMHNFIHATNISHHKFHSSYNVLCKFGSKHNLNDLPLNSWNIMKHRAKPPQQSPERHHLKSCSHWLTSGKMEVSKFLETQNQDLHKLYSSLFPQFIQLVCVVADAPTKIKKKPGDDVKIESRRIFCTSRNKNHLDLKGR